jgi:hypothetical protein
MNSSIPLTAAYMTGKVSTTEIDAPPWREQLVNDHGNLPATSVARLFATPVAALPTMTATVVSPFQ